jgi:aarF domain-containing kinase
MAGRRLLDAAKLLHATRTVAKQHLALRSEQLDVYNKTSSLARAVKSQTDRVTLTAQAAIELAKRLNEDDNRSSHEKPLNAETGSTASAQQRAAAESARRADRASEPDVSPGIQIPEHQTTGEEPQGTFRDADIDQEVFYERPKAEDATPSPSPKETIPQHPDLGGAAVEEVQRSKINPDTFPIPQSDESKPNAKLEEEEVPEEVDVNVFHTKRGASLLDQRAVDSRRTPYAQKQSELPNTAEKVSEMPPKAVDDAADQTRVADTALPYQMRESRVPSSRVGRLWQYGGLATSMAFGAIGETFRRATGADASGPSIMLSAGNLERLVAKLSRMRGAALKLGQMISFQGEY